MIEGRANANGRFGAGGRAVFTMSAIALALDLLYGMVVPTFSLYVTSLGGSAFLVGVLAAAVGLTATVGAFPIGSLSDRVGRKAELVVGSLIFCIASLLVTVPSEPGLLIIPRVLYGVALLATFPVGIAYLTDAVAPSGRALAIAIYVSAQGLGFTIGPLLGGWIASTQGFPAVYYACATIGLIATGVGWLVLDFDKPVTHPSGQHLSKRPSFLGGPILGASMANTCMLFMANGAVLPFLSLYGATLGLGTFAIGVLYATRSGASVLARIPAGVVARRVPHGTMVLAALLVDALAAFAIAGSASPTPLFIAAIVDGIAFGVFMTAGQCVVADEAPPDHRGAAIGSFAAAGAAGETVGALLFGAIAHVVGLDAVFVVAGILLLLGVPIVSKLLRQRQRFTPSAAGGM
jgi:MFS family permease